MGVKISTQLEETFSPTIDSGVAVNNIVQGLSADNPLVTSDDLIVDHMDVKSWRLDETSGPAFSLDLFTLINAGTLSSEAKFIHVQCHKYVTSDKDRVSPIRFQLATDQGTIGNMSQYTIVDISSFVPTQLTVSNVAVGTGVEAVLTVVIGLDK